MMGYCRHSRSTVSTYELAHAQNKLTYAFIRVSLSYGPTYDNHEQGKIRDLQKALMRYALGKREICRAFGLAIAGKLSLE